MHPILTRVRDLLRSLSRVTVTPVAEPVDEAAAPAPAAPAAETVLTIRSGTVVRVALLVLLVVTGFSLLEQVIDVLLLVLFALIIASALMPVVDWLQAWHLPRAVGALLIYILGVGLLVLMVVLVVPLVAEQVLDLARNVQGIVEKLLREGPQTLPLVGPTLSKFFEHADAGALASDLRQPLQELGTSLLGVTTNLFTGIGKLTAGLFDLVAVVIISFYLLVRRTLFAGFLKLITPAAYEQATLRQHRRIVERMGAWLRAQLFVMLLAFLLSWIGFSIIGLRYALFLSILAGIFAIIPVVGWITAGVLAALLALTQSAWVLLGVLVVVFVVHFAEAYVFIPLVTERAVGLSPVAVIISLLAGAKLAGLMGVLLAVPVATALALLLEEHDAHESRTARAA